MFKKSNPALPGRVLTFQIEFIYFVRIFFVSLSPISNFHYSLSLKLTQSRFIKVNISKIFKPNTRVKTTHFYCVDQQRTLTGFQIFFLIE